MIIIYKYPVGAMGYGYRFNFYLELSLSNVIDTDYGDINFAP